MKVIENRPNAASLIQSLRDIGYELDTALADIVDNSITAQADKITINFEVHPQLKVFIADNGDGMSKEMLISAMKIGSRSPLSQIVNNDLGRFGLGLKTASFSQCKKLSVITYDGYELSGAIWDLDRVTQTNRWELALLNELQCAEIFKDHAIDQKSSGTIVIWEACDRLVDSLESIEADHIFQKFENAEKHLALTFHRFLDKSNDKTFKCSNIDLYINNRKIEYIDPFFSKNRATQVHAEEYIHYKQHKIRIQGYTLPHHSKCSEKDYEYHALDTGYRDNQGFYIYRENRLLIYGTWFKIIKKSDLTSLSRVQIDLPNQIDSDWHLDIKKSHASPPIKIREQLKIYIDSYIKGSKRVYTSKGYKHQTNYTPVWQKFTDKNISYYTINREYPLFKDLSSSMSEQQKEQLMELMQMIQSCLPLDQIYADYASDPKSFKTQYNEKELEELALQRLVSLDKAILDIENIANFLKSTEPFNFYTKEWNKFLQKNWK